MRIHVNVSEDTNEKLKELATKLKISKSKLIDFALNEFISNEVTEDESDEKDS